MNATQVYIAATRRLGDFLINLGRRLTASEQINDTSSSAPPVVDMEATFWWALADRVIERFEPGMAWGLDDRAELVEELKVHMAPLLDGSYVRAGRNSGRKVAPKCKREAGRP